MPLYFSQNRSVDHFKLLHDITEGHTAALMDKYVGRDWEQSIDELERIRDQQREVVSQPALGIAVEEGIRFGFWSGVRQTDEGTSVAGYYRQVPNRTGRWRSNSAHCCLDFPHEEAELWLFSFARREAPNWDRLRQVADGIRSMTRRG